MSAPSSPDLRQRMADTLREHNSYFGLYSWRCTCGEWTALRVDTFPEHVADVLIAELGLIREQAYGDTTTFRWVTLWERVQ